MAEDCACNNMDFERDDRWAKIHPDLLNQITKCINSHGDYVRLRSVCKTWSLELPRNPEHIKNPWLVLPFDNENETYRPLLNVGQNKVHYLNLPDTRKTMLRGSYYQWLIIIAIDGELQMLNPFTRVQLGLPPLSTFPDVKSYNPDRLGDEYTCMDEGEEYTVEKIHMQKTHVHKIIISCPPDHDNQDFMAIAIYGDHGGLAYCKIGDCKWTDFSRTKMDCSYEDVIFYKGIVYAIDEKGQMYEFDMKTRLGGISEAPALSHLNLDNTEQNHKYLVGTPDGLLMVVRLLKWNYKHPIFNGAKLTSCYWTNGFEIYKLNRNKWIRVDSLGNYVILLGFNSSLCMSPDTFSDGKKNRIYFTDNKMEYHFIEGIGGHDIGVFDLENGSISQLFPGTDLFHPPPIWLLHGVP